MSVDAIKSFVVVFPNQGSNNRDLNIDDDTEVFRLQPNISFTQNIKTNIHILKKAPADRGLAKRGFLYVPDLSIRDECYRIAIRYIPQNVTRQANLPHTDYRLIALAPWINPQCTLAFLESAYMTTTRAIIFYLPDNSKTTPAPESDVWNLQDRGDWRQRYRYPVYIISGKAGQELMHQLSLYSGNMTEVPYGHQIASASGINSQDYVRIFTNIDGTTATVFPSVWVFLLVVAGALVSLLVTISLSMHLIQHRRRHSLRRRVANGEVDLEALGIKRLCVPPEFIENLPLFVYSNAGDDRTPQAGSRSAMDSATVEERSGKCKDISWKSEIRTSSWTSNPPAFTVISDTSNLDYNFFHKFLPYSQPKCVICLEDFHDSGTTIRELTCGHIFHPDCIDAYLGSSSLCPICKKSALPRGYCPVITNGMVRREINIRRLRSRVTVNTRNGVIDAQHHRRALWYPAVRFGKTIFSTGHEGPSDVESPMVVATTQTVFKPISVYHLRFTDQGSSRREVAEQRIRELANEQIQIEDPDVEERHRHKWKSPLLKVFPGFA